VLILTSANHAAALKQLVIRSHPLWTWSTQHSIYRTFSLAATYFDVECEGYPVYIEALYRSMSRILVLQASFSDNSGYHHHTGIFRSY